MKHETVHEAVKAAPPLGVGGLSLFGVSLNEAVLILTAIYTVFLIIDKLPNVIRVLRMAWRHFKEKRDGESD